MKVKEIMKNDPVCCAPDTNLQHVAALMAQHHCGELPICEKGSRKPIGVITDRDITCRAVARGLNPLDLLASDCMTSPCVTATPETDVGRCCHLMEEHLIRRLPVVDKDGNLCGIISLADIARKLDGSSTARVVKSVSQPFEHAARLWA